jgi:hypothetical protein
MTRDDLKKDPELYAKIRKAAHEQVRQLRAKMRAEQEAKKVEERKLHPAK